MEVGCRRGREEGGAAWREQPHQSTQKPRRLPEVGRPPAAPQQPPPPCSQPCPQPWKTLTLSLAPQQTHTCSPTPFTHTRHSHTHTRSPSLTTARVPVLHSAPRTRGWHDLGLPSAGEARPDQAGACLGLRPLRLLVPWPTSTRESPGGVLGPPRASAGWTLACRGCTTPASELILPPPTTTPAFIPQPRRAARAPAFRKPPPRVSARWAHCLVRPCCSLLVPVRHAAPGLRWTPKIHSQQDRGRRIRGQPQGIRGGAGRRGQRSSAHHPR